MGDTNKNVTKMGVITKGVCCIYLPISLPHTYHLSTYLLVTHHNPNDDEKMFGFNIKLDISNHFNIVGVNENKKIT
jgi:hypothetical protein